MDNTGITCKNNCFRYMSKDQPCPWNYLYADLEDGANDCMDFVGYWDKKWIAENTSELYLSN